MAYSAPWARLAKAWRAFRLSYSRDCDLTQCTGEARITHLMSASPSAVYARAGHPPHATGFISANVRELLGHDPCDFTGTAGFHDAHIHPDDRAVVATMLERLVRDGAAVEEYRFRHRDGSWRWLRDEAAMQRDAMGRPMEIIGSLSDISRHRAADMALAESERRLTVARGLLEDALDNTDDAFTLFDAEDRLVAYNQRYLAFYPTIAELVRPGVEFADLLRTSAYRGQYAGVNAENAEEWVQARLRRHGRREGSFEQMLSDGRCLEILERPTRDGGTVAIRRDVTARRHMEQALRHELAFEQTLIDSFPFPVFYKGRDGIYLGCNRAFEAALGLPRDRIVGRTLFDILPRAKAEEYAATDVELLSRRGQQSYETTMRWADGSLRRLQVVKGTYDGPDGRTAGFIGSLIDVTPQKRAEEQLVQAAKLATLGQVASEIAHELNQPLSIIRMSAESCLERCRRGPVEPAWTARKLEVIAGQVARMSEMVNHLRVFSRQDTGEPRPFLLAQAATSALRLLQMQMQLDDIAVDCDLAAEGVEVLGHPGQMEQVLLNLLSNARDAVLAHRPPGGRSIRLSLRAAAEPGMVTLEVEDNGGGVPDHLWPSVFEPFFTTKEEGVGTGLGLSISASIITAMGGRIDGCNRGEGACFTLGLPIHDGSRHTGSKAAADACEPGISPAAPPPARVLVVDDEPLAVECLVDHLERRGFDVVPATGAAQALEAAGGPPVDIVLSDLRMPGMGGEMLVAELRRRMPGLVAVLMTGQQGDPASVDPRTVLVRKPVQLDALDRAIDGLLRETAECPQ